MALAFTGYQVVRMCRCSWNSSSLGVALVIGTASGHVLGRGAVKAMPRRCVAAPTR